MLALVPVGIAVLLALPVVLAIRRVAREAVALRRELAVFTELVEPVREARLEAERFRARLPELRERARPSATSAP